MTLEIACRELIAFPQNQQTYPKSRNEDWKNDKKRTMQTSVETPSSHIKPTTCATNNSFQLHGQVLFSPFFFTSGIMFEKGGTSPTLKVACQGISRRRPASSAGRRSALVGIGICTTCSISPAMREFHRRRKR